MYDAMANLNAGVFGGETGKRGAQSFSIVRVDFAEELFANIVRSFIHSENLHAFAGEHGHTGNSIPLVRKHPARLGGEAKALVAFSQCLQSLESNAGCIPRGLSTR